MSSHDDDHHETERNNDDGKESLLPSSPAAATIMSSSSSKIGPTSENKIGPTSENKIGPNSDNDDLYVKRPALTVTMRNTTYDYIKSKKMGVSERLKKSAKTACKCNPWKFMKSRIPILDWLPKYSPRYNFMGDLISGCTVVVMILPQGMGYALLAGLEPVYGLYLAFFPVLIYALLGTSRHISMGPMPVVCMMVGAVVNKLATEPSPSSTVDGGSSNATDGYTPQEVVAALTLAVGIWQVALGLLQLGVLSVFLSDMLVKGFTTGAAVHVMTSQIKYIFGIPVPRHAGPLKIVYTLKDIILNLPNSNVATVITSAIFIFIFAVSNEHIKPRIKKKTPIPFPSEFLGIVFGTIVSYTADFKGRFGVTVVGVVPTGLPAPRIAQPTLMPYVIFDGLVIAIVAYTISLSMAKIFAKKHNYEIDATQELYGQGLSNVFGSLFQVPPIASGLSRSLVQEGSGGITQVTTFISASIMLMILLFIGPAFETLPICVLSSIIVVALKRMFLQLSDLKDRWKLSRPDASIWFSTFIGVVLIDVDYGLVLGLFVSVVVLMIRNQSPPTAMLGHIPDTDLYLELKKYSTVRTIPHMCIFQFGGALHFANLEYFQRSLIKETGLDPQTIKNPKKKKKKAEDHELESGEPSQETQNVAVIILELSRMSSLDSSGAKFLMQLYKDYQEVGISVALVAMPDLAMDSLKRCGCLETISESNIFHSTHDAVTKMRKEYVSDVKNGVGSLEKGTRSPDMTTTNA